MKENDWKPLLWVSVFWLFVAVVLTVFVTKNQTATSLGSGLLWTLGLWCFGVADMWALARALWSVVLWMRCEDQKKLPYAIQAFYWGMIKLALIAALIITLVTVRNIPAVSIILGLGTLVIVPLVGGYWWSMRAIKNARST